MCPTDANCSFISKCAILRSVDFYFAVLFADHIFIFQYLLNYFLHVQTRFAFNYLWFWGGVGLLAKSKTFWGKDFQEMLIAD